MCDMQKMPTREKDAPCEDDKEMNFTAFSALGGAGTHFVTTGGQLPVAKMQQNVSNNGGALPQVVGVVGGMLPEGMQYVRALDGGASLQTPQLISVPIALPGAKPGDPQPTVQIQVLSPNLALQSQQQPKYQMQVPIQGFQQGAVITLAYSSDNNDAGGLQLLGNSLPEGLQVLTAMPQEMKMEIPTKDQMQQNIQHQVFVTQNNQIVISPLDVTKPNNNNNNNNNNDDNNDDDNNDDLEVLVKQESVDRINDDESSQGTEEGEGVSWSLTSNSQDLVKYLNALPPQQTQSLPPSLQQFLRLNPIEKSSLAADGSPNSEDKHSAVTDAAADTYSDVRIKKKKKYKKPPKPAQPRPGQVTIATASDGTAIFCCPECQMAYPVKEQLEMHLIVHKIERRFICGICGAGLKRKEHLERHKLGHNPERPYVCDVCNKGFKRREHLNLHAVIHSGVKTQLCGVCGKGFYRKDHLRKHARSHENRRAREGQAAHGDDKLAPTDTNIVQEITIHVPTSSNTQMPIQISIPQHVVSSLQAPNTSIDPHCQLDALLADNS